MMRRLILTGCLLAMLLAASASQPGILGAPGIPGAGAATDFTSSAGSWNQHGLWLYIAADGQAVARWRVYIWCNLLTKPAPCDSILDGHIEDGGLAMIGFTSWSDATAVGTILMSSDLSVFEPGDVIKFTQLPGGVGQIEPARAPYLLLCGPAFDSTQFRVPPCGA